MKNGIFLVACLVVAIAANSGSAQAPNPQNALQQAPVGQRNMLPAPFQIDAAQAQFINQVLTFWEYRSSKVFHYETTFKRWVYDSQFGPIDQHKTYSEGLIKYEKPDKGMFQIELIKHWQAPAQPGQQPNYAERPGEIMEHWVCDGQSIFEFDVANKKLKEFQLPPGQQGQAIANGPLPFIFGAKKDDILRRFYLRVTTPPNVKNEYWLEAWPKYKEDGDNYRYIELIIDQEQFLPVAIQVFDRSFNPDAQPPNLSRTVYEFTDRKPYAENDLAANLQQLFRRSFFKPTLPSGWQKVVVNPGQTSQNSANRPDGPVPR